eukprot:TRINITY_DN144_c0_g3_i3.p2 TRINITY_DN144_c0_g3~~TRINITY_DN144_c0_g3_i3.p2  ORF type:complete len:366 (+),score=169.90 TRINITY_DN144_c0_g3_i3:64-1098(+)
MEVSNGNGDIADGDASVEADVPCEEEDEQQQQEQAVGGGPEEDCEGQLALQSIEHSGTGVRYNVGDYAMFGTSATSSKPRVGLIEHIKQPPDPAADVKLKLRLFYWPEDTRVGLHDYHGRVELVDSDDTATTTASELKGKCYVEPIVDYGKRDKPPQDVFYYVDFYDHVKGRIQRSVSGVGQLAAEFADSGDDDAAAGKKRKGDGEGGGDGSKKKKKRNKARSSKRSRPPTQPADDQHASGNGSGCEAPSQLSSSDSAAAAASSGNTGLPAAAAAGSAVQTTPTKRKPQRQQIEWKEGMVVWGKVRTFPWWPARIVPAESVSERIQQQQRRPDTWLVQFIGSDD